MWGDLRVGDSGSIGEPIRGAGAPPWSHMGDKGGMVDKGREGIGRNKVMGRKGR